MAALEAVPQTAASLHIQEPRLGAGSTHRARQDVGQSGEESHRHPPPYDGARVEGLRRTKGRREQQQHDQRRRHLNNE